MEFAFHLDHARTVERLRWPYFRNTIWLQASASLFASLGIASARRDCCCLSSWPGAGSTRVTGFAGFTSGMGSGFDFGAEPVFRCATRHAAGRACRSDCRSLRPRSGCSDCAQAHGGRDPSRSRCRPIAGRGLRFSKHQHIADFHQILCWFLMVRSRNIGRSCPSLSAVPLAG